MIRLMTLCYLFSSVLFLSFLSMDSQAQTPPILPEKIWIFDNNEKKVTYPRQFTKNHPVQHYNLDQTTQFEQQFSLGLSNDPKTAKQQALKRIQLLTTLQKNQMRQSYTGIVNAHQMRIRLIPAIVFEYQGNNYVVYGQKRAEKALQEFQQWQINH